MSEYQVYVTVGMAVSLLCCRYLKLPTSDMTYSDLKDIVKQTKPDAGLFALWKNIITKGFVEMPAKKHLY